MTGAFVHMFNDELNTLGKGLKALWSKKAEIGSDVVDGLKGLGRGMNRLDNVNSSKFSQEGNVMFNLLKINVNTNINVTESMNVIDIVENYNDVKGWIK